MAVFVGFRHLRFQKTRIEIQNIPYGIFNIDGDGFPADYSSIGIFPEFSFEIDSPLSSYQNNFERKVINLQKCCRD